MKVGDIYDGPGHAVTVVAIEDGDVWYVPVYRQSKEQFSQIHPNKIEAPAPIERVPNSPENCPDVRSYGQHCLHYNERTEWCCMCDYEKASF